MFGIFPIESRNIQKCRRLDEMTQLRLAFCDAHHPFWVNWMSSMIVYFGPCQHQTESSAASNLSCPKGQRLNLATQWRTHRDEYSWQTLLLQADILLPHSKVGLSLPPPFLLHLALHAKRSERCRSIEDEDGWCFQMMAFLFVGGSVARRVVWMSPFVLTVVQRTPEPWAIGMQGKHELRYLKAEHTAGAMR